MQRGPAYHHGMRKAFADKSQNYSPSTSYNYNPAGGMHGQGGGQQHPRRRTDRFKRELVSAVERLAKQNEIMIKLLREIRDRLAVSAGESVSSGAAAQSGPESMPPAQTREQEGAGSDQDDYDEEDDAF